MRDLAERRRRHTRSEVAASPERAVFPFNDERSQTGITTETTWTKLFRSFTALLRVPTSVRGGESARSQTSSVGRYSSIIRTMGGAGRLATSHSASAEPGHDPLFGSAPRA